MTALRNADEVFSDGLVVAMALKGLPEYFKPFTIHVTQRDETIYFAEFKTKLRSYEDTEKMRAAATDDNVMNVRQQRGRPVGTGDRGAERAAADVVCFKCASVNHEPVTARAPHTGARPADGNSAGIETTHVRSPGRQMTRTWSMPSE